MNSAITGTNYDLNEKSDDYDVGLGTAVLEVQSATKWSDTFSCQRNLKLNLDS